MPWLTHLLDANIRCIYTARVTKNNGGTISATEVRALALRVQGFGEVWPGDPIEVLFRLGTLQLDSVSVLARPQELVPFSRMGAFSPAAMADAV
jgi:uncharacterized protein YcaQ